MWSKVQTSYVAPYNSESCMRTPSDPSEDHLVADTEHITYRKVLCGSCLQSLRQSTALIRMRQSGTDTPPRRDTAGTAAFGNP
jgi:hypothetical protein